MALLLYLLGIVVAISGLACLATLIGVSQPHVLAGAVALFVLAAIAALAQARTAS